MHFSPEEYRTLAERNGLRVLPHRDVRTRNGTSVAGRRLPALPGAPSAPGPHSASERCEAFISDALDRYGAAVAATPDEQNTAKFYQMEVVLAAA